MLRKVPYGVYTHYSRWANSGLDYWIKKIKKGTAWELYVSSESALSYKYRLYNGTYSVENLRDYFESVDFDLEEDHWREIGAGRTAEVVPMRAAKKANGPYFTVFTETIT